MTTLPDVSFVWEPISPLKLIEMVSLIILTTVRRHKMAPMQGHVPGVRSGHSAWVMGIVVLKVFAA